MEQDFKASVEDEEEEDKVKTAISTSSMMLRFGGAGGRP